MRICSCGSPLPGRCCPHCGACQRSAPAVLASAALVLGLGLTACGEEVIVQPAYGVPPSFDEDGDGYAPPEDCDDADADVYPGAPETAGDGVDSDCDGEDDPQA